jgi:hypothetical protein
MMMMMMMAMMTMTMTMMMGMMMIMMMMEVIGTHSYDMLFLSDCGECNDDLLLHVPYCTYS